MRATAELVAFFGDLGVRAAGSSFDIIYHEELDGNLYGANLICIGGPDANSVTRRILDKIDSTVALGNPLGHVVSMRDTITGIRYSPRVMFDDEGRAITTRDYGLLVKTSNPFNETSSVLIIAGSFGFGTWAGVKLARSRSFLKMASSLKSSSIECLYCTEVVEDVPQATQIIAMRPVGKSDN